MGSLAELIERVEKATGPDREIDVAIAEAVTPLLLPSLKWDRTGNLSSIEDPRVTVEAPLFTSSLDSIVALIAEKLPKGYRASGRTSAYPGMIPGSPRAKFFAEVGDWGSPARAYHDVEPIALLLAFLRAKDRDND